jgi:hypothetical protein
MLWLRLKQKDAAKSHCSYTTLPVLPGPETASPAIEQKPTAILAESHRYFTVFF